MIVCVVLFPLSISRRILTKEHSSLLHQKLVVVHMLCHMMRLLVAGGTFGSPCSCSAVFLFRIMNDSERYSRQPGGGPRYRSTIADCWPHYFSKFEDGASWKSFSKYIKQWTILFFFRTWYDASPPRSHLLILQSPSSRMGFYTKFWLLCCSCTHFTFQRILSCFIVPPNIRDVFRLSTIFIIIIYILLLYYVLINYHSQSKSSISCHL